MENKPLPSPKATPVFTDTVRLSRREKKKTRIVAHRGVSWLETENTCTAFASAGQRSYFGIETDIHRTLDGEFINIHDNNMARVSGVDHTVEDSTYAESAAITLIDTDGKTPRSDLHTPKLSEYISICAHYKKYAVLELKNDFDEDELRKIVSIIEGYGYFDRVVFISFYLSVLKRLRALRPDAVVQYLVSVAPKGTDPKEHEKQFISDLLENRMDLDAHHSLITKDLLKTLHKAGLKVNAWTVNTKEEAVRLCKMGIDFITSNIIE